LPLRAEQGGALEDTVLDRAMQAKILKSPIYSRLLF